mmetsp:Transcript_145359/g.256281  ORF Transcript_145359/g.256281 Transcript_145359/m.256281 type:complete len:99 (+) Transcript_145359:408-704(+)
MAPRFQRVTRHRHRTLSQQPFQGSILHRQDPPELYRLMDSGAVPSTVLQLQVQQMPGSRLYTCNTISNGVHCFVVMEAAFSFQECYIVASRFTETALV